MSAPASNDRERARTASGEDLAALLHHHAADVLLALLDNPAMDESHFHILLERKDVPTAVLEEVGRRKPLLKSYRVKRALAFHPRTPRLASLRILRELYLMDLVQLTLLPGIPAELKRNAEDQLIARLPQLPLGQKVTLARRGPSRVAGVLLAEGHTQVVAVVLDNPNLTEAQILKVLSREKLPLNVVPAISHHRKWSSTYNVRLALVRNPGSSLSTILAYLPELTVSDLRELVAPGIVSETLRKYLQAEIQRRILRGAEKSVKESQAQDDSILPEEE
jgi:predicted regulator of amino acid metabolism with ACT domain